MVAVVLGLVSISNIQAADVTGTCEAESDTQTGLQKYTYTLRQDGDKVTGKAGSHIGGEKREVELKEEKQVTPSTVCNFLSTRGKRTP